MSKQINDNASDCAVGKRLAAGMVLVLFAIFVMLVLPLIRLPGSRQPPAVRAKIAELGGQLSFDGRILSFEWNEKVSDVSLSEVDLSQLTNLRIVYLSHTRIGDITMTRLARVAPLYILRVDNTLVTNDGVRCLKSLEQLQELSLNGTQVTDAIIPLLTDMKALKKVYVEDTNVTNEGKNKLRAALERQTVPAFGSTAGSLDRATLRH
mgnify:CR=1 FL=1